MINIPHHAGHMVVRLVYVCDLYSGRKYGSVAGCPSLVWEAQVQDTGSPHSRGSHLEFCQMEWDEGVTTAGVYRDLLMNWFAQCWVPVCHAGDPGTSPRSPA